jgi:hypothetical protein
MGWEMEKCPFCAEEIQDDAMKCKFCGKWLKDSILDPEIEEILSNKNTDAKLAEGYDLYKAKKYGWAWIIIIFGHSQMIKPGSWINDLQSPISTILFFLGFYLFVFLFYFWLRWKIIKRMVKNKSYEEKKWLPPTVAIFASYLVTFLILYTMRIFG